MSLEYDSPPSLEFADLLLAAHRHRDQLRDCELSSL